MNKSLENTIERFLALLKEYQSNELLLESLKKSDLVTGDFENRYLIHHGDVGFRNVRLVKVTETYFVVYVDAGDSWPYRIEAINLKRWRIKSFLFLCAGCFGEDNYCGVCGGKGWGVL